MSRGQPYSNKTLIFQPYVFFKHPLFLYHNRMDCLTFHVLLDKIHLYAHDKYHASFQEYLFYVNILRKFPQLSNMLFDS